MMKRAALAILSFALFVAQSAVPPRPSPGRAHPEMWPSVAALPRDPKIEKRIDDILRKMTLEEKAGQVIQGSITSVKPEDVRTYHLGSVLNGGGGFPGDVRKARPKDWLALADAYYAASMDTSDGKQAIPIIWGSDAVHGHSNVVGSTLFPHNVGLGATRNYDLIRRIGEITAIEMNTTGIDWDFSPVVAVTRDDRWGRTYESYSEDPEIVRAAAAAMIEGLQGRPGTAGFLGEGKVVGTAKHFLADGGTVGGKDQGDVIVEEAELRDIHGAGYVATMHSGAQAVMSSQSSWHGVEMHGNHSLLTEVLKQRLGFDGILVGDWNGHAQVPGCTNKSCAQALNAGVDMFMVPDDWKDLHGSIVAQVRAGEVPMARLDDAVRRILRVKLRAGLFTRVKPSLRTYGKKSELLGSPAHRQVARQAVRESLVLLKNDGALPIRPDRRVLVTGQGADSISMASGGWTVTWQGDGNTNAEFPGGTSIWQGIRSVVEAAGGRAVLSAEGSFSEKPDVAIVVFGEQPYAEWEGDLKTLVYENEKELATLRRLRAAGVPVVSLFLSGRPLWVNPFLNASSAFVAAWLPGSEGAGVADVLFTASDGAVRNDFRGKLSFSWPKLPTQLVLNRDDAGYDPLFPIGFGLTYAERVDLPSLPVDTSMIDGGRVFYTAGVVEPWELTVQEGLTAWDEAGGRKVVSWPGNGRAEVALRGKEPVNLLREAKEGRELAIDIVLENKPVSPVLIGMGGGTVDVSGMLAPLDLHRWYTIHIGLRCFADAGADMSRIDTPFRIATGGKLTLRFADIEIVRSADAESPCPPAAK